MVTSQGAHAQGGPGERGRDAWARLGGHGGGLPTATVANLVLGYLSVDNLLDGELTLDRRLAERAIERHVADALVTGLLDAAVDLADRE